MPGVLADAMGEQPQHEFVAVTREMKQWVCGPSCYRCYGCDDDAAATSGFPAFHSSRLSRKQSARLQWAELPFADCRLRDGFWRGAGQHRPVALHPLQSLAPLVWKTALQRLQAVIRVEPYIRYAAVAAVVIFKASGRFGPVCSR